MTFTSLKTDAFASEIEVAAVVIGRNEGARLIASLAFLEGGGGVIYVGSGSTDGRLEAAQAHGALVMALNMSQPFTAARAFLQAHSHAAAVCGRQHKRFPKASVYNRLCDQE